MGVFFRRGWTNLTHFNCPINHGIIWVPLRIDMNWWLLYRVMHCLNYWLGWRITMQNNISWGCDVPSLDRLWLHSHCLGWLCLYSYRLNRLCLHPYSASCLWISKTLNLACASWCLHRCHVNHLPLIKLTIWMCHQIWFRLFNLSCSLLMSPSRLFLRPNKIIVQLNRQFLRSLPQSIVILQHFFQHLSKLSRVQFWNKLQSLPHNLVQNIQCVILVAEATWTQCRCLKHNHTKHKDVRLVVDVVRNSALLISQGYEHLWRDQTEPSAIQHQFIGWCVDKLWW